MKVKNIQIGLFNFFRFSSPKEKDIVDRYTEWRKQSYPDAARHEGRWVRHFETFIDVELLSASTADVERYRRYIDREFGTVHAMNRAMRALSNFYAHFHARGMPCLGRKAFGKS
jgi:hypothetical protein